MNNQFILNNELRKHCHLENLGSMVLWKAWYGWARSGAKKVTVPSEAPGHGPQPAAWLVEDHPG